MFASIGQPTSQVTSITTSSEDERYRLDTSDYEQWVVEEKEDTVYESDQRGWFRDEEVKASGLRKPNPNNQGNRHVNGLVERLESLILETKAGHDGLYDEMLYIPKPLLYMNIINQEQLDYFVFNMVNKE